MKVIFTRYDFMKAMGCPRRTLYNWLKSGAIDKITSKGKITHIIYDTNMHNDGTTMAQQWHNDGTPMAQQWHNDGTPMAHGIPFSVIVDSAAMGCDDLEMAQRWHNDGTAMAQRWHNDGTANILDGENKPINERLVSVLSTMNPAEAGATHTGYIQLHRKLLGHPIMETPILAAVFMELMLMAGNKGEVIISSQSKLASTIGPKQYAAALTLLEEEHGVIASEVVGSDIKVKIVKWSKYQPHTEGSIVLRDMDTGEVITSNGATPPDPEQQHPSLPTPLPNNNNNYNKITPYNGDRGVGEEPNQTPEPEPKPERKPRKKREKKLKTPRDPYKLEDYEPQYRPFVPDAHEIYEYYRDLTKVSSSRIKAIDLIVPLLTIHSKEDMINCVDNYYASCRKKWGNENKYIRAAQSFFNEFFAGYLESEKPKTTHAPLSAGKARKERDPNVTYITVPPIKNQNDKPQ